MLKILLVTSEINYMPGNYNPLIEGLLANERPNGYKISGVVELKTLDKQLLSPLVKMPFVGMYKMPLQIIKNIRSEKVNQIRQKICTRACIPLLKWQSMNTPQARNWVVDHEIDIILNIRTRCIYKKAILNAPKIGCINIHHGILPHYRGTFCDLYALSEYRAAGYSIHRMVKKIDDGEVYKVTQVLHRKAQERVDYIDYLKRTIDFEIEDLTHLLNQINTTQKLPEPLKFTSNPSDILYTKNPTPKEIIKLIRQGITL